MPCSGDDSVYEHAEDRPPFRLGGLFLFMQDVKEQSNRDVARHIAEVLEAGEELLP